MQDAMPVYEDQDQPTGARRPDPGSPGARLLAWLLVIPMLAGVLVFQHWEPPAPPPDSLVTPPTAVDPFTVMAKLEAKLWHATVQAGQKDPKLPGAFMDNLDKSARTPLDRLRGAVVAGEMAGESEARARLAGVEDEHRAPLLDDELRRDARDAVGAHVSGLEPVEASQALLDGERHRDLERVGRDRGAGLGHHRASSHRGGGGCREDRRGARAR